MKRTAMIISALMLLAGCDSDVMLYTWDEQGEQTAQTSEISVSAENSGALESGDTFSNECEITLGDTISVQGGGAVVKENRISITEGGVYIISGVLSDGAVSVESSEPVKLILNGATILSESGPAIACASEKLMMKTARGSENLLYSKSGAAVSAEKALILGGDGSLMIDALEYGIESGGNLKVSGGEVVVCGYASAIRAGGEITVSDGSLFAFGNGELPEISGGISRKFESGDFFGTHILVRDGSGNILVKKPVSLPVSGAVFSSENCADFVIECSAED